MSELFHNTAFWHRKKDVVICTACPRNCHLHTNQRGLCFVRQEHQGEIILNSYGRSSGFCIDPIEKKPLNHFFPGSPVLSFGTAGCNLACKFCQNWDISKAKTQDALTKEARPEAIAKAAQNCGCQSVAFSYNDPVIFSEYAVDTAIACKELGIHSVAVSAGYVENSAREYLFGHMTAANIDLKAFNERFYFKLCGGHLKPVLDTLKYIYHETQCWLEITTLIIEGHNDSQKEITTMCEWIIENLSPLVPLHFTAFHPDFKMMQEPATSPNTLLTARETAINCGMKFVYVGNVHHSTASSTYCPSCGNLVIERDWYQLGQWQLEKHGHCQHCGYQLPGHFHKNPGDWGPKRQVIRMIS